MNSEYDFDVFHVQIPLSEGHASIILPQSLQPCDVEKIGRVLALLPLNPTDAIRDEIATKVDRWESEANDGDEPLVARTLGNLAHEIREDGNA